ncbi:D-alanine--D-alanyl carrier protein ligase [Pseudoalteromonas sp. CIP111854]|uniref:D-alanine--D-alanyl carrier protein ligase n=1 Tax=Pseudoalteromonas holothuriae TaxID=2963714 RepID=A0A9W4R4H1_9GAMM|nr:type I polyketide synthase [Pseudoalteromonas sp. CIP111854]CAH9066788.1 D-alanine--D-alanyl carrier protein ligase [Pseudoalteromonas sp. CIP111854]
MNVQEITPITEKTLSSNEAKSGPVITDLVLCCPKHQAAQTALTFLDVKGELECQFSYQQLEQQSLAHGAAIQRHADVGDVVLVALENMVDFVSVFFGCMVAGVVAVPVPTPKGERDKKGLSRVFNIAQAAGANLIVSDNLAIKALSGLDGLTGQLLSMEQLKVDAKSGELKSISIVSQNTAYLQFTSGSTAMPKGVKLSHANVMASVRDMADIFTLPDDLRSCGWLPMHHDMGLVGLLLTLYQRGQAILMPPAAFLSDPERWLKAIDEYQGNMCAAPNFAFVHCVKILKQTSHDLSSLTHVFVGSEFVSVPTLDAFCDKFAPNGFQASSFIPVYGLAEATLLAAGGAEQYPQMRHSVIEYAPNDKATKRQLLGYAIQPHFPIQIIEDNKIVVAGDAVASSYWPNNKAYCHRIDGRDYFETGDVGFIQNNRLYLTGREKDTLIVRGVNHHAEDLEFSISARVGEYHGNCACIATTQNEREQLIVVQEASRHIKFEQAEKLKAQIQNALIEEHGITPDDIIFIANNTLPRTLNHKVSRASCLVQYEAKRLKLVGKKKPLIPASDELSLMQLHHATDEPITIVSMACRLPGGCDNPEAFWELLSQGKDAVREVPSSRWNNDSFYHPQPATPGKTNTRWAGFVDDIDMFDPAFFGISPTEAVEIDPQQRLLLETSWRLFEGAGLTREQLKGSDTGVFIGVSTNDYLYMKIKLMPGMDSFNAYSGLGNANSITANRISYLFDLKGPSMAIDTACSSSLTALHLAAQSVNNGECRQAIAGGVNALISPGPTISLSQFGMMAPDGRCKTFDSSADGYVRAEGCALVMLKSKADALQAGDKVLGYIRASALGQDGHSNGITHPNADAQERLIRRTLAKAKIDPATVTYIEAHGTGTSAGDPIEVNKLREIYGKGDEACFIGSVKASIGHLEAGAGIASVLKILTMLQHEKIPPQLHLKTLNPAIELADSRLSIAQNEEEWHCAGPRRAAVSSFGFGGALAHMIIEQGPGSNDAPRVVRTVKSELFTLSAADNTALVNQARIWLDWLNGCRSQWQGMSLASVCYTQAQHRTDFSARFAVTVKSFDGLVKELERFIRFKPIANSRIDLLQPHTHPAFVFTGQGQNYFQMGYALYQRFDVFRQAFDRCMTVYNQITHGQPFRELVFECLEHAKVDASTYQCHLFSVQYSLAELWFSLGVTPQVLVGHSIGEYAAAVVAGCMTVEDAMELLYRRGKLIETVAPGEMVSLKADRQTVEALLPNIAIAAQNSPKATVIAGSSEHIAYAIDMAKAKNIEVKKLNTERAFHSPMMADIVDTFVTYAAKVQYNEPSIPWVSTVTGKVQKQAPTAEYWGRQLQQTVLFEQAVKVIGELSTFIEIGPGGTTLAMLNENLVQQQALFLRSCNRTKADRGETDTLLDSIGKFYQQGNQLHWNTMYKKLERQFVSVPPQHFNCKRYWIKGASWDKLDAFSSSALDIDTGTEVQSDTPPLYQINWNLSPVSAGQMTNIINWIVIGESSDLMQSVIQGLNGQVYQVSPQSSKQAYHQQFTHILNTLAKVGDEHWRVLYANSMGRASEVTVDSLNVDQDVHGPADLTRVVQALLETGKVMPLWILTQHANFLEGDNPEVMGIMQSSVWGFARTLFLEQPQLRGGIIDMDSPCEVLLKQLHLPQQERVVAIRNNQRFIAQLEALSAPENTSLKLRKNGIYLITGGLGGLGLKSCEWLVEQGVGDILLLGRSGFPERSQWTSLDKKHKCYQAVQSLIAMQKLAEQSGGVNIQVKSLDIRDSKAMTQLFASLDKPLRGVIHAAGVNWFGKIAELDTQKMLDTLKTNISAAWLLHELTADADLDCFVMYSSVSALWGSVELAHYTAANYFLDTLAHYRVARGLPALSIDWGPWGEVGMSAKESEKTVLNKLGLKLMSPSSALDAMKSLLSLGTVQAMVGGVDWLKFKAFIDFSLSPSLFAKVESGSKEGFASDDNGLSAIASMPRQDALALIDGIVRDQLASVMLIDSIDTLGENHRFNFLGMDSLMAISFAAQLEQYLGVKMPNTLAYNYPTIKDVKQFIYQQLTGKLPQEKTATPEVNHWLLPIDEQQQGMRLYCFPYAGSGASAYAEWKGRIPGANITAVQYPGRENHNVSPITNMSHMVENIIEQIDTSLPFALIGHSLGALIAYEVAGELDKRNQSPQFVVLSGCDSPQEHKGGDLHRLDDDAFLDAIIQRYDHQHIQQEQKDAMAANLATLRADITLLETYRPSLYTLACSTHILGSQNDPVTTLSGLQSWIGLSKGRFCLSLHEGSHYLVKENPTPIIDAIKAQMH